MPHKHTRRKGADYSDFDLAPSAKVRPLPAFQKDVKQKPKEKKKQVDANGAAKIQPSISRGYKEDDTPRAFARLMARQQFTGKRPYSDLDNGEGKKAKKKKSEPASTMPRDVTEKTDAPKILPGERLSDYATRVNQALPVAGLARRGKVHIDGMKDRQTKMEKRLHKMYAEWREQDAKHKERLEELAEQEEEENDEKSAELGTGSITMPLSRRSRRKRTLTETGEDDEDPWAVLQDRREKPKGLHDVAQAPPVLKPVKDKFKLKNGAKVNVLDVPNAAGSLKKREELGSARREVIERYRAMMKTNRT